MKKFILKTTLFSIIVFGFLVISNSIVNAATPTLSVTAQNDGDSVQLNVTGDPNSSVILHYYKTGTGQQILPLGNTNASGTLSTTLSSASNGISSGSLVYILLGGINGAQSQTVVWPTVTNVSSGNMLSLSQTGVVLQAGQSSSITASNLNSSNMYLYSNSNPAIATVNISGSQITVIANSYGSTTATVCLVNNSSNCASIYIVVQTAYAQPLTFSQASVNLYSGQSVSIGISGGTAPYTVSNNSSQNNGIVQTSISGSNIILSTTSTSGSSSITVCSNNMSSCGVITVSINSGSAAAISFSQTNPSVIVGQSLNVNVYGPSNSILYISSNSNPSIVQANLSGNVLTFLGIANGTSSVNVCSSANNCGTINITVSYNSGGTGGHPTLSEDSISISVGQTKSITISGGMMPYSILSNTNNVFQPTLNSNILSIYATGVGSQTMNICSYSGGGCSTLSIKVNPSNYVPNLPAGCTSSIGWSPISGAKCDGSNITPAPANNTDTNTDHNSNFYFTLPLKLGSKGNEVKELQKKLKLLGYYNGKIDGGFGIGTLKSVKSFQKAHKLQQLGNIGPGTRAALNKI